MRLKLGCFGAVVVTIMAGMYAFYAIVLGIQCLMLGPEYYTKGIVALLVALLIGVTIWMVITYVCGKSYIVKPVNMIVKWLGFDGRNSDNKTKNTSIFNTTKNTRMLIKDNPRYIRSDVPTSLTRGEINWLSDNNVKIIVDLRTEHERKKTRCCLENLPEFNYLHMPVSNGDSIPENPALVASSYLDMVDGNMMKIIDVIEKSKDNVLFFCTAGKDRTGVVAALLLKRMGAADERIIDDYVESAGNLRSKLERYVNEHPETDINVITPQRAYMQEFLDFCDKKMSGVCKEN